MLAWRFAGHDLRKYRSPGGAGVVPVERLGGSLARRCASVFSETFPRYLTDAASVRGKGFLVTQLLNEA
jgi:hypothetical protein